MCYLRGMEPRRRSRRNRDAEMRSQLRRATSVPTNIQLSAISGGARPVGGASTEREFRRGIKGRAMTLLSDRKPRACRGALRCNRSKTGRGPDRCRISFSPSGARHRTSRAAFRALPAVAFAAEVDCLVNLAPASRAALDMLGERPDVRELQISYPGPSKWPKDSTVA
jgi:hypothetical protein